MRKTFFLLWLILLLITKSYNIYSQNFWEATNGPHRNVWSLAINSSDHIFVGTNAGIYRSIDNGESWTEINSGLDTTYAIKALAINSNNHIFAGTYRNVFRSTDNGESWTKINTGLATYIDVYSIKINSSNHIFIGTLYDSPYGGGRIYRSTDNGENWTQLSNSPSDVYSLVINLNDNIFAGTVNGVFRSTDNGNNWSQINNGLTIPYVQSLTINSSDYIFAGAYNNLGGKVFRSTDSGENWIDITNGLPSQPIECFVINTSDQIFLSPLGAGIFISVNDGNNWSQINNGLTEPWVKALAINSEGYIFAGTFNSSNVNNGIVFKSIEPVDSVTTKTPVIFVPGIMGSPLYQDENNDNHLLPKEKAWVEKSLSGFLNLFYLPLAENGIDPEDEDANIKVAPLRNDPPITLREEFNHQPMDVYKNFFGNLESQGYILDNYDDNHTQGENLFCFTYDWRKNNTVNAQLLSEFIDDVKNWTGSSKVNLIGHSMGGLVSKKCISIFDKSRIDKIIFIGTPHLGAPETMTVLFTGEIGMWYDLVTGNFIKTLANNLPSCYQLAPSINYFNLNLKNEISSDVENYLLCFQLPNGNYTTYTEMNEYMDEHLSQFLNDNSESFRESISNVDFGSIKVFNIVGYNLSTIGQNRVIPFEPPLFIAGRILNGDQTVPLRSAEIINNQVVENTYYIPDVVHSALPSSLETLEILLGVLKNPAITNFPQYSEPPQSYSAPNHIQGEVACPIALHAYDSLGRHTGPLTDSTWEANIPGSIYIPGDLNDSTSSKTILLPAGNTYRFEMESLNENGAFNFFLHEVTDGNVSKFLIYDSIPFQTNTMVTCSLNTVSSLPPLDVDLDNNGTIDTVITPSDFTVSVESNKIELPTTFILSQNYPNPFNPITKINYSIPQTSFVTLKVYDILGNEIKTLVNEENSIGNYEIEFNGSNLASGVYFYRIVTKDFVKTMKMLTIK